MRDAHRKLAPRGAARGLLVLALAAAVAGVLALVLLLGGQQGERGADATDVRAPAASDAALPLAGGVDGAERLAALAVPAADAGPAGLPIRPGVRLAGPGTLAGRVVERGTGAGVEGARVELFALPPTGKDMLGRIYRSAKLDPSWSRRLAPVATVASGPGGAFELRGVRVGTYFIEARGALSVPEQAVLVRVDAAGAGGPVLIHVRPGGRVTGFIRRPDGAPQGGAKVLLYAGHTHFLTAARSGDFRMFETTADRGGAFVIAGVPPGEGYELSGAASGFALSHAGPFAVAAGADTEVELALRAGATVRGRVLSRAAEGDGAEGLQPVAGAHVGALTHGLRDLGLAAEVLAATHAVTNQNGEYVMRNVPPGEIDVGAALQGLQPARSPPVLAVEGGACEAEPVVLEGGPRVTLRCKDDQGAPLADVGTSWFVTDFDSLQFEATFTPLMLQAIEGFEFPRSDAQGVLVAGPFPGSTPHKIFCWRAGYTFEEVEWSPARDGDELEVVLSRGGAVEGIVMDLERAEPVQRFEIKTERRLEPVDEAPSAFNPFSGGLWVEDQGGRFRLEGLSASGAPVVFSAPGYLPEEVPLAVTPGETTRGVIVKLRRGGTIRGRILDRHGEGIPGAQVAAMDERGRPVAGRLKTPRASGRSPKEMLGQEIAMTSMELFSGLGVLGAGFVVSGDDGAYELTGLPEGTVAIHAAHRDFADAQSAPLSVPLGDPLEGLDLVLSSGGGIFGTVSDRYGAPVAGALVLVFSTDRMAETEPSARWVRQAGTDAEGSYRIEHMEPGGYFLACSRGDASLNLTSFLGTLNFDLVSVPGDELVRYDLTDSSAAAVRVFGTLSAEGELVRAGGLFALGFESENVLGVDVKVAPVRRDGTYLFEGLAPGPYTLTYQGDGPEVRMEVEIPDAPEHRLDLVLPAGGVAGRVLDAAGEAPVHGAEVVVTRADGPAAAGIVGALIQREGRAARAFADGEGRFELRRLQAGKYLLQAGPPRWGDDRGRHGPAEPLSLEVEEGVMTRGVEVRLAPALELRGRVVDGTGAPVEGARVYAFARGDVGLRPATARSVDDGAFVLRGLAPGTYDVSASADEHAESPVLEALVGDAPPADLVLQLQAGVPVVVTVRDSLGAPVQGATGRLVALTAGGRAAAASLDRTLAGLLSGEGVSGADGRLDLGPHAPGTYRLEVGRGALLVAEEPVILKEGEPLRLDVELR